MSVPRECEHRASPLLGRDRGVARMRVTELQHYTHRMLQALDAYWLHYDGLPEGRYPRGRYCAEDWWHRFQKYRALVEGRSV